MVSCAAVRLENVRWQDFTGNFSANLVAGVFLLFVAENCFFELKIHVCGFKDTSAAKGTGMIRCKKVFVPGTAFPHPGYRAEQGRIRQGGISGRGFACCPFGGFALRRVTGL